MDIISSKNVVNIIRKTLNLIDNRLIHHGERVGYILNKMLMCENSHTKKEILTYTIAALLHDIGAYKNEELDKMIQFETVNVWGHSIYGYLFLKYLSPIQNVAETVLYHHLDHQKLVKLNSPYEAVAGYLNLADRIDICLMHDDNINMDKLFMEYSNVKFSEEALELFKRAEKEYHILEKINDNTYLDELNRIFEEVVFTQNEKELFIRMLIYSIDFRSEYTVMHTITTVSIADEIGHLMNLGKYDLDILHYGAILHDIGKITTPVNILEAPRKLTTEEMVIMKNHVLMSEYILKDYINQDILEIATRHHEKLDGSGYYRGLTMDELTLPQRILAVADIISALGGKRSYKDSFNKETILNIIRKDSLNGKICPDAVECVLLHFDEIMNNVKKSTYKSLHIYAEMKTKYDKLYEKLLSLD
ncbi:MAG: HD domain-containing phosphohydrolase [Anaerocolumna sp.]